jgi:hypothetical protein
MPTQGRLFPLPEVGPRRMRRAAEATIRVMRQAERLEEADAVLVAALRTACELVDERRGDPDQGLRLDKALTIVLAVDQRLRGLESPVPDALADLFTQLGQGVEASSS